MGAYHHHKGRLHQLPLVLRYYDQIFIVFSYYCIIEFSCIVIGFEYQAWYLEFLCFGDVGYVISCRWRIIWEDRIGVICVMVNSCGDGLGIISIAVSYDTRFARIRFNVFLDGSVVVRKYRGRVLVVM